MISWNLCDFFCFGFDILTISFVRHDWIWLPTGMCFARETKQKSITVSLIFVLVAGYFVSSLQAQVHFKRSTSTPACNFSRETFPKRKPEMAGDMWCVELAIGSKELLKTITITFQMDSDGQWTRNLGIHLGCLIMLWPHELLNAFK